MIFTVKIINTFLPTRTVIGYIANKEERGEIIQVLEQNICKVKKLTSNFLTLAFDYSTLYL
jgi:hypothetical protein